jgi:hypothetical protein
LLRSFVTRAILDILPLLLMPVLRCFSLSKLDALILTHQDIAERQVSALQQAGAEE